MQEEEVLLKSRNHARRATSGKNTHCCVLPKKKEKVLILSYWHYNCHSGMQNLKANWDQRPSRQECIWWLNFPLPFIFWAELGEINVMQERIEAGPEVPSLSSKDVLLNRTVLKIRKFSKTAHGSLDTELSLCSYVSSGLETQSSCPYCHILTCCLYVVWINQLTLGWGNQTTHIQTLSLRKKGAGATGERKLRNSYREENSCSQWWEKSSLLVLPCISL